MFVQNTAILHEENTNKYPEKYAACVWIFSEIVLVTLFALQGYVGSSYRKNLQSTLKIKLTAEELLLNKYSFIYNNLNLLNNNQPGLLLDYAHIIRRCPILMQTNLTWGYIQLLNVVGHSLIYNNQQYHRC